VVARSTAVMNDMVEGAGKPPVSAVVVINKAGHFNGLKGKNTSSYSHIENFD